MSQQQQTAAWLAVRRGAEILDEVEGVMWRDVVDTERLDTESFTNCVLGQVFGNFPDGCAALAEHYGRSEYDLDPSYYGFDCDQDIDMMFHDLDVAWKEYLDGKA